MSLPDQARPEAPQGAGGSTPAAAPARGGRAPRVRSTSLFSAGEAQVWLTGGALALCLLMITGLLVLVAAQGARAFWPGPLLELTTHDGRRLLGEVASDERYRIDPLLLARLAPEDRARAEAEMAAGDGTLRRRQLRTGNYDLTGTHFTWVSDFEVASEAEPRWALLLERMTWGRFYGVPRALLEGEAVREEASPAGGPPRVLPPRPESLLPVAEGPEAAWAAFEARHEQVRERLERRRRLETEEVGAINARIEGARHAVRRAELALEGTAGLAAFRLAVVAGLAHAAWTRAREAARAAGRAHEEPEPPRAPARPVLAAQPAAVAAFAEALEAQDRNDRACQQEFLAVRQQIERLRAENQRQVLLMATADGQVELRVPLEEVVRAVPANQLGTGGRLATTLARWGEFLGDEPREANSEGGVAPAILGTVVMTLVMSLLVVPFGVLAALYLREYARPGPVVSVVRIAINNLAGVPSIVFGVFGLGFFCYTLGAGIDGWLYPERLPSPTFGKGGLLWASFTLALLTLPVVIVATEEALAAVPRSMREGSYACGASKWQTIRRIVLPRAMPGIMTGMILAIARGAGEVAPLMLVGVVKLAPEPPVDATFPFVHGERSFMHLGFHVYDLGFQSQNSEAAKPMVFTTTLLLIGLVVLLNVVAIWVRSRLRRKFLAVQA
ncbi:MAG: phosphate ABC transporter permease PstA [Planctomycetia bacterium]